MNLEYLEKMNQNHLKNKDMEESNCCGALPLWESDICSDCGEHAEFNYTDEDIK